MMSKKDRKMKIAIVDDSNFYNKLLTRQLEMYAETLTLESDKSCDFEIRSYVHPDDFLRNLREDLDAVIIDYYLGGGVRGIDLIEAVTKKAKDCKILVISQARNIFTSSQTIHKGATEFVHKRDKHALPKACFFVEDMFQSKYGH